MILKENTDLLHLTSLTLFPLYIMACSSDLCYRGSNGFVLNIICKRNNLTAWDIKNKAFNIN